MPPNFDYTFLANLIGQLPVVAVVLFVVFKLQAVFDKQFDALSKAFYHLGNKIERLTLAFVAHMDKEEQQRVKQILDTFEHMKEVEK